MSYILLEGMSRIQESMQASDVCFANVSGQTVTLHITQKYLLWLLLEEG